MTKPIGDPAAYELISARDGGDVPAIVRVPTGPTGAEITAGEAISADGRMVVFRTRAPSDLPAAPFATVPLGQIFVRDREAKSTVLVTREQGRRLSRRRARRRAVPAGDQRRRLDRRVVRRRTQRPSDATCSRPRTAELDLLPLAPGRRWPVSAHPSYHRRRRSGRSRLPAGFAGGPERPDLARPVLRAPDPSGGHARPAPPTACCRSLSADGTEGRLPRRPGLRPDPVSGTLRDLFVTDMSAGVTRKAGTLEFTREETAERRSDRVGGDLRRRAEDRIRHAPRPCSRCRPPGSQPRCPCVTAPWPSYTWSISPRWRWSVCCAATTARTSTETSSGNVGALAMSDNGSRHRLRCPARPTSTSATATPATGRVRALGGGPERGRAASAPASRPSPRSGPPARAAPRSTPAPRG